jgi:hypothetical protein
LRAAASGGAKDSGTGLKACEHLRRERHRHRRRDRTKIPERFAVREHARDRERLGSRALDQFELDVHGDAAGSDDVHAHGGAGGERGAGEGQVESPHLDPGAISRDRAEDQVGGECDENQFLHDLKD